MVKRLSRGQLARMKKTLLIDLAKQLEIPGRSGMTKEDLIRAISQKIAGKDHPKPVLADDENSLPTSPAQDHRDGLAEPAPKDQPRKYPESGASESSSARHNPGRPAVVHEFPRPHDPEPFLAPPVTEVAPLHKGRKGKRPTQASSPISEDQLSGELPAGYDRDRLVLQVRDPYWAHAYWDFSRATLLMLQSRLSEPLATANFILRIHDITGRDFPAQQPNSFYDIRIRHQSGNWYLNLGKPGAAFVVDLGIIAATGEFIRIMRSNTIQVPTDHISEVTNDQWLVVDETFTEHRPISEQETMFESMPKPVAPAPVPESPFAPQKWLGGALFGPSSPGMPDSVGLPAGITSPGSNLPGRLLETPTSPGVTSSLGAPTSFGAPGAAHAPTSPEGAGFSVPLSSPSSPSSWGEMPGSVSGASRGTQSPENLPPDQFGRTGRDKDFWLVVHTELIVYGATVPGSRVTVQSLPIDLRPDGTFSLRFALPDGEQHIPVRAVNADGDMERTITPVVRKWTR